MPQLKVENPAQPSRAPTATKEAFGAAKGRGLGDVGSAISATAQIAQSVSEARGREAANNYAAELRLGEVRITSDINDLPNWETRFNDLEASLRERFGSTPFMSNGVFEENANLRSLERRASLETTLNSRLVESGNAAVKANVAHEADNFAGALMSGDIEDVRDVAQLHLDKITREYLLAAKDGLIYSQDVELAAKSARKDAIGKAIKAISYADPERAEQVLQAYREEVGEAAASLYDREITEAYQSQLAREAANESREIRLENAARKQREDAAYDDLLQLALPGEGEGLTLDDVRERWDDLGSEKALALVSIVQEGGFLGSHSISNPASVERAIRAMTDESLRIDPNTGEPKSYHNYIWDAVQRKELTVALGRALQKQDQDSRFGGLVGNIGEIIKAVGFSGDPVRVARAVEGAQEMMEWIRDNPNASVKEARAQQKDIIEELDMEGVLRNAVIERPMELSDFRQGDVYNIGAAEREANRRQNLPEDDPDYITQERYRTLVKFIRQQDSLQKRANRPLGGTVTADGTFQ